MFATLVSARAADGLCPLFVGRLLVFANVTEARASSLALTIGGDAITAKSEPKPVTPQNDRSVGRCIARALRSTPTRVPEQALA